MSLRFQLIIMFVLVCSIFGCSSSKNYYINPAYKSKKVSSTTLILPIQREWFDQQVYHSFGHLSKKDKSAFNSLLAPLFGEYTTARILTVDEDTVISGKNFELSSLVLGEKKFQTLLPKKEAEFSFNPEPRFVVLLDQYFFRTKKQEAVSSAYAGHESGAKQLLYFETKYVYWDNIKKEPVAWGNSQATVSVAESVSFPDYSDVLSMAIKKIVDQGPIP